LLADLWPSTIDEHGIFVVMIEYTALILFVIGVAIWFFARWSKREKAKRERDVNTAINLRR
jgi:type IV secretory pathway TrbD component